MDLFEQSPLLDDIGNCLHLDTLCFVDVFESIELASLFMLDHTDLDAGGFISERRRWRARTLPNAPLPTQRRRTK
jgi:hypothetical protein